ncbi:MAG: hypothetical protein JWN08_2954 [Frankiales bacterium]|jgi:uncharacterized protein YndB with AHSA1/START domain|nr:hypothetical protein [Frankiales bacterium]
MTATTPTGSVLQDEQGLVLVFDRVLDAGAADVWAALTEPARVARWFGTVTGDPATGEVEVRMTAEGADAAEPVQLVECRPASLLVVDLPSPDGTWRVSVALERRGARTELRFEQRLAEPYDATSIGPGWQYYLDRLMAVVAGEPVPEGFDEYLLLADAYALPS